MSDEHYPGEADCAMTDHAQLDTVEQLRVRVAELETELEEYRHLAEMGGTDHRAGGDDTMNDTTKTDPITDLLTERGKNYGLFMDQAATSQALKDTLRDGPRWGSLTNDMAEALDLIAMKMSRIVHGNPNHMDSWDDIAGYARLVADRLRGVVR